MREASDSRRCCQSLFCNIQLLLHDANVHPRLVGRSVLGGTLKTDLLPALALEGLVQQLLAGGGGEVHPRVPAQLDAECHASAAPRLGVHGGARGGRGRRGGTCYYQAAAVRVTLFRKF